MKWPWHRHNWSQWSALVSTTSIIAYQDRYCLDKKCNKGHRKYHL